MKSSSGTAKQIMMHWKQVFQQRTKIPAVSSSVKVSEEQKASLEEELKQAQTDRSSAKTALSEATAFQEKEATEFAA